MSLAVNPLRVTQMLEPRTKVYNERTYSILRGGSQSSWKVVNSNSYSSASIQFEAPPPNPSIIVDRKVKIRIPLLVTITATANTSGGGLHQAGYSAPRSRPIQRITNVANCVLNNTQVSMNVSDIVDAMLHYQDNAETRELDDSMSPAMLDQSQLYSQLIGASRNPLNDFKSSVSGADLPRGAFNFSVLSNPVNGTTTTILLDATDYFFMPPFESSCRDTPGFIGIQTMSFNIVLNNLARAWSYVSPSGVTGVSVSAVINSPPQLFFNYITPNSLVPIPKSVVYPFYDVQRYGTQCGSLAPNETKIVPSSNIQLHSIPNRLYILARRLNSEQSAFTTDTFALISNISVNWNNKNGQMSGASTQDLWALSRTNGLQLSYTQFTRDVGSVICVVFGKDICLDADEAPGLMGNYNIQFNATVTNLNPSETIAFELYAIAVSEGAITIGDNRAITQIGLMSREDVLSSINAPMVDYQKNECYRGAGFFSDVGNWFKNAAIDTYNFGKSAYNTVAPIVKEVLPYVKEAKSLLGMGISGGTGVKGTAYAKYVTKKIAEGVKRDDARAMWMASPERKRALARKAKKLEEKRALPCAEGKVRRAVKMCLPDRRLKKKKKGNGLDGGVLEGGDLLDRDEMQELMNQYA